MTRNSRFPRSLPVSRYVLTRRWGTCLDLRACRQALAREMSVRSETSRSGEINNTPPHFTHSLHTAAKCFFAMGALVFNGLVSMWAGRWRPVQRSIPVTSTRLVHAQYLFFRQQTLQQTSPRPPNGPQGEHRGDFDDISGDDRGVTKGFVVVVIPAAGARLTNSIICATSSVFPCWRTASAATLPRSLLLAGLNGLFKLKIPFPSCLPSWVPRPPFFKNPRNGPEDCRGAHVRIPS